MRALDCLGNLAVHGNCENDASNSQGFIIFNGCGDISGVDGLMQAFRELLLEA